MSEPIIFPGETLGDALARYHKLLRDQQEANRKLLARVEEIQGFIGLIGEAQELIVGLADDLELEYPGNPRSKEAYAFLAKIGYRRRAE